MAVYLAVAGAAIDGVLFALSFFPQDVLDEIWDCIELVPENVPTCSYLVSQVVLVISDFLRKKGSKFI